MQHEEDPYKPPNTIVFGSGCPGSTLNTDHLHGLQVLQFIEHDLVPLLKRCSLAGHASLRTHNPLFDRHNNAADMLIDVLSDRGFSVAYLYDFHPLPVSVDMTTGAVKTKMDGFHNFRWGLFRQMIILVLHKQPQKQLASIAQISMWLSFTLHLDQGCDCGQTTGPVRLPDIEQQCRLASSDEVVLWLLQDHI